MSGNEGLEEFGGLARWRDVKVRFPNGLTKLYLVPEIGGRLPKNFDRPLNDAQTAFERFALVDAAAELPVYEWIDMLER